MNASPTLSLPPLRILSEKNQHDLVVTHLRRRARSGPIHILEAGCGRQWYYDLQGAQYKLTGVDLDGEALEVRKRQEGDLDEVIVGDLRDVPLPANEYDVIYTSYVLEHIDGARTVLDNFLRWSKPDGLVIIYIPDCQSAYGFFSRYTPHWLHVWFYRFVLGRRDAGKAGNAPYPTYYDEVVSRAGIREYASDNGLDLCEECGYYRPPGLTRLFMNAAHALSFGKLAASHCDLLFILERRVAPGLVPVRVESSALTER